MFLSANIIKTFRGGPSRALAACFLFFLAGCASTLAMRISDNRAAFDSYPPPVQQAIQAGHAEVGFTPDQVHLAMGTPDRIYSRQGPEGYSEVWTYFMRHTSFAFGVGVGGGGGRSSYGGGVGVGTSPRGGGEVRVIFAGGRVVSVEIFR